jgi:Na+/melibiose symporter-like transporter
MGWFAILLTPVVVAAAASQTPERLARARAHAPVRLADYWSLIVKPDLVRLYLSQMALTLGPGWMSAMYLFFFKDVMRFTAGEASLLLLVYIIAGLAGAPLTAQLATRIGKHRTLMATTTAYSLGLCTVLLVPKGNVPAALPTMFWCGFMAAGFDLMIRAMLADVADEVRLEQGKERVSLIYALNGLAAKLAAALAIGVTFPLLARLGYVAQAGATNTPQAIHNLALAFIVGPIIFVMLGGACLVGWRLDAQRHRTIRAALDDLDARATLGIPDGEPTAAAAQLSDRERA